MEVRITARHGSISRSEETWIRAKLDRLSRFFHDTRPAQVVVEHAGDRSAVEMSICAPRGVQLSAHAEASTLKAAVKAAESKLETQLRKVKDRLLNRRGGHEATY